MKYVKFEIKYTMFCSFTIWQCDKLKPSRHEIFHMACLVLLTAHLAGNSTDE